MRRVLLSMLVVAGCQGGSVPMETAESPGAPSSRPREAAQYRVVMLGDSLTAGFGLSQGEAFPSLVEAELRAAGWPVTVINAGVSGDTSAGGNARLEWLLRQRPHVLFVCLGANDGLRGLPVEETEANLRAIVRAGREAGARVLLAGMRVPPNYGKDYGDRFSAVYPNLAAELDISFMPFLLEGVAGEAELNLADGIHPNAAGQRIIARNLAPYVENLLRQVRDEEVA